MNSSDTIVAISTPPGRSGLGVVRLSGPDARNISTKLVRRASGPKAEARLLPAREAVVVEIYDANTERLIDQAVATFFQGPRSFTGDDLVEISCHGSPVVLEEVVRLAMINGARIAEPGEFTFRAFINGRIDLAQAEAIHDLIQAKTLYQAQVAVQQAHGNLSRLLAPLKSRLVELIALLEAGIDFAEDDVPVADNALIQSRLSDLLEQVKPLLESYTVGRIVREGISLAIVGRPNVGKSSLFNRLLENERAIVADLPGTTRDLISETAQIHGIPVRLMDTAGIRQTTNVVEMEGVARSYAALSESDLVLMVLDASDPWTSEDVGLWELVKPLNHLMVINKRDLIGPEQRFTPKAFAMDAAWTLVSAKSGEGISELRKSILETVTGRSGPSNGMESLITNLRHQQMLLDGQTHLNEAMRAIQANEPHEMVLLFLYASLRSLDRITGATTVEDILGNIFSRFCIGK